MVAHLQQYCAGYQALASEREQLHHQYLQQVQLMDRLQHDESQGRVQLEISHSQLKQAQVCTAGRFCMSINDANDPVKSDVIIVLNASVSVCRTS